MWHVARKRSYLATGWTVRVRFPTTFKISSPLQLSIPALRPTQPAFYSMGTGVPSRGWIGRSVKATTYLHLVPTLWMCGCIPLLPLNASMTWARTCLPSQIRDTCVTALCTRVTLHRARSFSYDNEDLFLVMPGSDLGPALMVLTFFLFLLPSECPSTHYQ